MPTPPWFKKRPHKWLATTVHLSLAAQGALERLICHQWTLGPLPLSDPARRANLMSTTKRDADRLWRELEPEFTEQADGLWLHQQTASDYADATHVSGARARAGAQGGRSRWDKASSKDIANANSAEPPSNSNCHPRPDGKRLANAIQQDSNCQKVAIVLPMASTRDQSTDLITSKSEISVLDFPQTASTPSAPVRARQGSSGIRPKNPNAFFQGSVFDVPGKWAQQVLRESNGQLRAPDLTRFCVELCARVEANNEDIIAKGNKLAWLDKELHQWRSQRADAAQRTKLQASADKHLTKVQRMEQGAYD